MASEGSREIDAAKKRVAAAKAQASGASTNIEYAKAMMENGQSMIEIGQSMMESGKLMIENLQSQLQSSQKEVKDAEKCLEETEKRWDVIDIDQESDISPEKNTQNKKRKALVSPEKSNRNPSHAARRASVGATVRQSNSNGSSTSNVGQIASTGAAASSSNFSSSWPVDKIVVEGSGMEEVNGIFKRFMARKLHDGGPVYSKKGKWKGQIENFVMLRKNSGWIIGVTSGKESPGCSLYVSPHNVNCENPPKGGWIVQGGVEPAPQCRPSNDNENLDAGRTRTKVSLSTHGSNGNVSNNAARASVGAIARQPNNDRSSTSNVNRLMKRCRQILKELQDGDNLNIFAAPVDPIALGIPHYPDYIKTPMDLGTIQTKMDNNAIESPEEFARLVRLTFKNAIKFNRSPDNIVHIRARNLLVLFNKNFSTMDKTYNADKNRTRSLQMQNANS